MSTRCTKVEDLKNLTSFIIFVSPDVFFLKQYFGKWQSHFQFKLPPDNGTGVYVELHGRSHGRSLNGMIMISKMLEIFV